MPRHSASCKLKVNKDLSPNPAAVNEALVGQVQVHLYDAANEEIHPINDTFTWTTTVTKDGANYDNGGVSVTADPAGRVIFDVKVAANSFKDPGAYVVTITVVVADPGWGATTVSDTATLSDTIQDVVVHFSPSPIVTGYTQVFAFGQFIVDTINVVKKHVVATVVPASAANHVTFLVQGSPIVSFVTAGDPGNNQVTDPNGGKLKEDDVAGTIEFDITGTAPSVAATGDTTLLAQVNGVTKGQVQIVVVVPSNIGSDHLTHMDTVATGVNTALNATTAPAAPTVKPDEYYLVTTYTQVWTIPVVDQFGNPLDACYAGVATVDETINGTTSAMNQVMGVGSYTDPVFASTAAPTTFNPVAHVGITDPLVDLWKNHTTPSPINPLNFGYPLIGVTVGGFPLKTGIVNRYTSALANNHIITNWPGQPGPQQ